jgi:hypothetical protein
LEPTASSGQRKRLIREFQLNIVFKLGSSTISRAVMNGVPFGSVYDPISRTYRTSPLTYQAVGSLCEHCHWLFKMLFVGFTWQTRHVGVACATFLCSRLRRSCRKNISRPSLRKFARQRTNPGLARSIAISSLAARRRKADLDARKHGPTCT